MPKKQDLSHEKRSSQDNMWPLFLYGKFPKSWGLPRNHPYFCGFWTSSWGSPWIDTSILLGNQQRYMEVSINGGTPIAGWFIMEQHGKTIYKWMMTGGTPMTHLTSISFGPVSRWLSSGPRVSLTPLPTLTSMAWASGVAKRTCPAAVYSPWDTRAVDKEGMHRWEMVV